MCVEVLEEARKPAGQGYNRPMAMRLFWQVEGKVGPPPTLFGCWLLLLTGTCYRMCGTRTNL